MDRATFHVRGCDVTATQTEPLTRDEILTALRHLRTSRSLAAQRQCIVQAAGMTVRMDALLEQLHEMGSTNHPSEEEP